MAYIIDKSIVEYCDKKTIVFEFAFTENDTALCVSQLACILLAIACVVFCIINANVKNNKNDLQNFLKKILENIILKAIFN